MREKIKKAAIQYFLNPKSRIALNRLRFAEEEAKENGGYPEDMQALYKEAYAEAHKKINSA